MPVKTIGRTNADKRLRIVNACDVETDSDTVFGATEYRAIRQVLLDESIVELQKAWQETSHQIQRLRDNPECADSEFALLVDDQCSALFADLTFNPQDDIAAPYIHSGAKPKIAVLREQGVNGQVEMAAAFTRAGFDAYDVHMSDLMAGRVHLADFKMLAACGGFSYGDVLGAGEGWAKSILFHPALRDQFAAFFADPTR